MSQAVAQVGPQSPSPSPPHRRRRLLWNIGGLVVALAAVVAALCFWTTTPGFENLVRGRMVARLEATTGGRVEIHSFHWRLMDLEAEANGVVIHGLEEQGEAPYAQLDRLRVRLSVLGFWSPRILLRDLEVAGPRLHIIFYPDGSTNQPKPRETSEGEPVLDTLFDLKAGHVAVEQGVIDLDNRAANLDFQNRFQPLDFQANDASVVMKYMPAGGGNQESYHVEAGVRDLSLVRDAGSRSAPAPVHGFVQASIDLTRDAAYLRSLRLTSATRVGHDRTLEISGTLLNFAHPRWQAKAAGELDMRLLDPVLGYPFAPEGIARMNLAGAGQAGEFRADGTLHIDGGAYIAPGVAARDIELDAKVHADPLQLAISAITARFRQGGQVEGEVLLDHWLPPIPGQAVLAPSAGVGSNPTGAHQTGQETTQQTPQKSRKIWNRNKPQAPAIAQVEPNPRYVLVKPPQVDIPINGKVTAQVVDMTVDTVLDIVGQEPFKRLGIDARLNGPATAKWSNGNPLTTTVGANLSVSPSEGPVAGEVPASGFIDGTYTQHDGAVELRQFELNLPRSQVQAHGRLGAFPLTSSTDMNIDLHTRNLGDFDKVIRDLGLNRNGKSGSAALPVGLTGQADFDGTWAGSLVSPRLAGSLKATQLAIELPPNPNDKSGAPQFVRWDSVDADGSYGADRIAIVHGQVRRGPSQITLSGTLSAPNAARSTAGPGGLSPGGVPRGDEMPAFDSASLLRMQVHASKVGVNDLLPLTGLQAPVSGTLDAQFETDGPLHALGGSGWVELDDGIVYGEPVSRIRAQGVVANQVVKVASVTVTGKAGSVSGSGSYDLRSRHFQAEAHGAGVDIAKIERLRTGGETLAGKLGFSITAGGTPDDPRLVAHASLEGLTVGGEPLGTLDLTAHSVNRDLLYDMSTRLESAEVILHGQTGLHDDYPTQAKLDFSRFDIGTVFKLAHLEGISGESALAGMATVEGPLAHPEQLRGEARLQAMAMTVAGVHLQSEGGLHATLANGGINLDPVHITGDQTDMHARGSLGFKDNRRLDFAASGSVNLKLAETLDRDMSAGGTTTFQVEAHGPLANPDLRGRIDFDNGSLSLEDLPNGLSQLHGTLEFNQNRLEVRSLTAMTGGGQLSVGGYLAYQHGLYADLSVTGKQIRIRYPQGVSSLADATLHLQGTQPNLLLSGNIMLTRFSVSPDLDIAALTAQANAVQPVAPPDAPSNHIRLDVRVQSSPQLNFQNAYAKLAGDVDLRLRGTVASPSLLGRISITEGNAIIAGTRYELQRGDILFTNPVRIEPTIDLNATARVEDYDITLGLHGTAEKLGITYRSDPPLPEADVVALLALGRTQSEQGLYTQQQQQSAGLSPSTDVLLGGALNATVSSRVQKLFGAGAVKVDPSYLGALGNSTTRITVDEQLGKNVTLTYATNVDTSAQQLVQAEVAINRHVSLLVARDESGVFSMVLKATRRYR
jgi:translocation and assembly module TamB